MNSDHYFSSAPKVSILNYLKEKQQWKEPKKPQTKEMAYMDNGRAPHHPILPLVLLTFGVLFRADIGKTNTTYTYSCIHAYRPLYV